jgi:hypothetical protein
MIPDHIPDLLSTAADVLDTIDEDTFSLTDEQAYEVWSLVMQARDLIEDAIGVAAN